VPALYTADQATKGALAYYQNCAMCHGPLLDGQSGGYSGPALKGAEFADPSYDFHLSDIFNFVAKLMPAATPGSLTHEQDVQIMAFILQQNGYPPAAMSWFTRAPRNPRFQSDTTENKKLRFRRSLPEPRHA
jgi:polar amino acid transport system substrate-binding protein